MIGAHLRDFHGYSLVQSIERPPPEMRRIHQGEHDDHDCGHPDDDLRTKGGANG